MSYMVVTLKSWVEEPNTTREPMEQWWRTLLHHALDLWVFFLEACVYFYAWVAWLLSRSITRAIVVDGSNRSLAKVVIEKPARTSNANVALLSNAHQHIYWRRHSTTRCRSGRARRWWRLNAVTQKPCRQVFFIFSEATLVFILNFISDN